MGALARSLKQKQSDNNTAKSNSETPSIEFRMQTCRFLTELGMWRESVKVLEGVIGDDDERVEAWYLLAFGLFRLKKHATAEECCKSVKNLIEKFKIVDPELEAGTREIYEEIQKMRAKGKLPEVEVAAGDGGDGDDWATDSEEDVDGDDGADDEEMKD